jgi:hypothetical protein
MVKQLIINYLTKRAERRAKRIYERYKKQVFGQYLCARSVVSIWQDYVDHWTTEGTPEERLKMQQDIDRLTMVRDAYFTLHKLIQEKDYDIIPMK